MRWSKWPLAATLLLVHVSSTVSLYPRRFNSKSFRYLNPSPLKPRWPRHGRPRHPGRGRSRVRADRREMLSRSYLEGSKFRQIPRYHIEMPQDVVDMVEEIFIGDDDDDDDDDDKEGELRLRPLPRRPQSRPQPRPRPRQKSRAYRRQPQVVYHSAPHTKEARDTVGCIDSHGSLHVPGEVWELAGCGRATCAKSLYSGWERWEQRCQAGIRNPQYACRIEQDRTKPFPLCCPRPVECRDDI